MRRLGIGIALVLLLPASSLIAAAEGGAPVYSCFTSPRSGPPALGAFVLDNSSGHNATVELSVASLFDCGVQLVVAAPSQSTAPAPPAPLAFDFVSAVWVAPGAFQVTWRTNTPSMGRLWWGPSGGAAIGYLEDGTFSGIHTAEIRGLEPGVTYRFQAGAIDRESAYLISEPLMATPPAAGSSPPAFGLGAAFVIAAGTAVGLFRLRTAHRP